MDNLYFAFGLILVSVVLMGLELFVPTGGVLFVIAMAGVITGVAMTFASGLGAGGITLIVLLIVVPIFLRVVLYYGPKTPLGKKIFLPASEEDTAITSLASLQELESLKGRYGKTLSALRPSGITDFDGRRVDTLSEGMMIEAGQWVKCITVKAGRVVVRQVDRPPDWESLSSKDLL